MRTRIDPIANYRAAGLRANALLERTLGAGGVARDYCWLCHHPRIGTQHAPIVGACWEDADRHTFRSYADVGIEAVPVARRGIVLPQWELAQRVLCDPVLRLGFKKPEDWTGHIPARDRPIYVKNLDFTMGLHQDGVTLHKGQTLGAQRVVLFKLCEDALELHRRGPDLPNGNVGW